MNKTNKDITLLELIFWHKDVANKTDNKQQKYKLQSELKDTFGRKNRAYKGNQSWGWEGRNSISNRMVRIGPIKNMPFEQRAEDGKEAIHMNV